MAIDVECPGCGRHLRVDDKHQGRRAACPTCKAVVDIPMATTSVSDDDQQAPSPDVAPTRPDWLAKGIKPEGAEEAPKPFRVRSLPPVTPPPVAPSLPAVVPQATSIKRRSQSHSMGSASHESTNVVYPPYIHVPLIRDPKLVEIPDLVRFQHLRSGEEQLKAYRIRVLRPKFPWIVLAFCILIWPVIPLVVPILIAYHFLRQRGHTFLFLTTHRLVIVELSQGRFGRMQTVLNYSLASISGFSLYAQRGFKRFLNFFVYKEKRTFCISIITNTAAHFELGSENSLNSLYDPGLDAVTLCSELDSMVLAIKSGHLQGANQ